MNAKAFLVEVIEGPESTKTFIVRNQNGQPLVLTDDASEIASFFNKIKFEAKN